MHFRVRALLSILGLFALVYICVSLTLNQKLFPCFLSASFQQVSVTRTGVNYSQINVSSHTKYPSQQAHSTVGQQYVQQEANPDTRLKNKVRNKHTRRRRLPQCIIIGVQKAGTSALRNFLNLHPDIETAVKEIRFFNNEKSYLQGLDWYRKKMPYSFPDQITIEKSPTYFVTEQVPERIYHMNSSIKLLLLVREPVERAMSDYLQVTQKFQAKESFEAMAMTSSGEVNIQFPCVRRSMYYRYMKNWLEYFPLGQIHIVDGNLLVKDPLSEIQAVEKFLGVEQRIGRNNFYLPVNQSRGFYCIRNETWKKCLGASKGRAHPPLDPGVEAKLRNYYRSPNKKFFRMVHREFDWP